MGVTGAGKSRVSIYLFVNRQHYLIVILLPKFIQAVVEAHHHYDEVSDGLTSATRQVQALRITFQDQTRPLVLVDTPGFDDPQMSDGTVLRMILEWLKAL
jgi:predicted GTPase